MPCYSIRPQSSIFQRINDRVKADALYKLLGTQTRDCRFSSLRLFASPQATNPIGRYPDYSNRNH